MMRDALRQAMHGSGYPSCEAVARKMREGRTGKNEDAYRRRLAERIRQAMGDASRPSHDLVIALAKLFDCRAELFYLREPGQCTPGKRCNAKGRRAASKGRPTPTKVLN